ncbi:TadE/TadG family type IV pilus assembly protein [Taklimakanibacter deserti]|uniref:TadE/TadG family type IV pilus assembly protein n=1 Tax=Taklimakanibacter deserti TaxID=2267839 RepID=UPI000E65E405
MTAGNAAHAKGRRKITGARLLIAAFARKQDGAAAVEFALVALPFFWLLLVIFETAAVIFTDIALQNGLTETARLIRTGQVQTQNISESKFKELLCKNVASYINCTNIRVDITKSASLAAITGPDMMTVQDATAQSFQPGGPMEWVLVQARYDWQLTVPGISQLANMGPNSSVRRLVAGAMFRNEPYGG